MRLRARDDGGFDVLMGAVERRLLTDLCADMRRLLLEQVDDPLLVRLFPPAYADDDDRQAFYAQMTQDDLVRQRVEALDAIVRSLEAGRLDRDDTDRWLIGCNALRLALGTRLDVQQDDEGVDLDDLDPDDPDTVALVAYDWLAHVQAVVLRAIAGR